MKVSDFRIEHNQAAPVNGRVLIAGPFMKGEPFQRSVILICGDKEPGHLGFILNKPTKYTLNHVLKEQHPHFDLPLCIGGPVGTDHLLYIHSFSDISRAIPISEGLFVNGDFNEILIHLKEDDQPQHKIRFFVSYSGWSKGQLMQEIQNDSWMIGDIRTCDVFRSSSQQLWKQCMSELGEKYHYWSQYPLHPYWN